MSDDRKAVCIMAWPAGHSRSPLIHNYWIKQHNLNAEYRRESVPPEKFPEFVTHLREHGYIGGNVTVPHKQAALALSEKLNPFAYEQVLVIAAALGYRAWRVRQALDAETRSRGLH